MALPKHPSLFEVNTRVFLQSLGESATLKDIPARYWKDLRGKGIDWVWLMGIWEIREKALDPHLIPESMLTDFKKLLPDLTNDDICGSPYAIHQYRVDPLVGTPEDLASIRKGLHKLGMRLMLDFVPNHFGAHTVWADQHPEYFIEVDETVLAADPRTFYKSVTGDRCFAHGKDPYFEAWQDTIQVNYAAPDAQEWMADTLLEIGGMCDGVRCDMAMLAVKRIFQQTWAHHVSAHTMPEFWPMAIQKVRQQYPDFLFLAECYWDMEAELMQMGFDSCYDKVFFDRATDHDSDRMRQHFMAETWWLERTARFLENHDEERAAERLHLKKHMAAAALVAFGPGMRFWHMGQWEGWRKKLPVQLHRRPAEGHCACLLSCDVDAQACRCVHQMYVNLLEISQQEVFREGEWSNITDPVRPGLLIWRWKYRADDVLVLVNFSDAEASVSLIEVLKQLQVRQPYDLSCHAYLDPAKIPALAPWSVHLLRVKS